MTDRKLIANRWECPDGTVLQSFHRHHFVQHTDTITKKSCFVDGGIGWYIRTSVDMKDLCVYSTDTHELQREYFHWGTRGKAGKRDVEYIPLKALATDHIEAIIETQKQIPKYILELFYNELRYRERCVYKNV